MEMTSETWEVMDVTILWMSHAMTSTVITIDQPTVTANIVTSTYIDTNSFLKYVNVKILDKRGITNFYGNLMTQANWYNIFFRTSVDITLTDGLMSYSIIPESKAVMACTFHSKFSMESKIDSSYTDAYNFLSTITYKYVLLQIISK